MRNYCVDWNNNAVVIVKKEYLNNIQRGNTWEALEVKKWRDEGFTLKNGTRYTVACVQKTIQKNSFWAQALPTV